MAILRRIFSKPEAVFAAIFVWRLALLVFAALPVPSDDSFFYDGPVVNLLLHGKYTNPALAQALPISGTEVFSAYPPMYQAVVWGWMYCFGPSALSAMALHLALFGCYLLFLLGILRRLRAPGWAAGVAGAFLLVITFDDRPDSLAHVFGIAAVYALVRWRGAAAARAPWAWMMSVCAVLALGTSVQIGGVYGLLLWVGVVVGGYFGPSAALLRERGLLTLRRALPVGPMLAMVAVPAGLVALVAVGFPHLWAGFLEHARQTPSLTGWRWPRLDDVLKTVRNTSGILAAAAWFGCFGWLGGRRTSQAAAPAAPVWEGRDHLFGLWVVGLASTLAALVLVGGSLFVLTPNTALFAAQLQPVAVGCCLAWVAARRTGGARPRVLTWLFLALAGVGAIRAVGMTTWGAACAADVSYPSAVRCVRTELDGCAPGTTVVLSSAYLYEAARHRGLKWIYADWMAPARRHQPNDDWQGLLALRPAKIILTQFDYYRRLQPVMERLAAQPGLAQVQILNTARVPAPDSIPPLRRVVQHISWAPVVVTVSWK